MKLGKKQRRFAWLIVIAITIVVVGVMATSRHSGPIAGDAGIPTFIAQRGDVPVLVRITGEVRAGNAMSLVAPPIAGGVLQITKLLPSGTVVKKGDVVIEFDPSEQQYLLEQNESEYQQAGQEIAKAKADAAVQVAQDEVALLKARFAVRRAELEVGRNELVSTIDARKNELALEQAKRSFTQTEQDIKSHTAASTAGISLALEKQNKAQITIMRAKQNMTRMRITAPMDGVVSAEPNSDSSGGIYFDGMKLPEYKQGDQARPGSLIAQVIDTGKMNLAATVSERERGNVKPGQPVEIDLDAYPGLQLKGRVKSVAGSIQKEFWEVEATGSFGVTIEFLEPDPRIRTGLTAQVNIPVDVKKNVVWVPRHAIFVKDGKRVAYVRNGGAYRAQDVKVLAETASRAIAEGLQGGDEVALINPEIPRQKTASQNAESPLGGSLR